ncbi:MAG: hypothetical protein LC802_08670 [Acidobacteria bacterium]|nr:hypothetical protein [Acidobacteriota bacterium]
MTAERRGLLPAALALAGAGCLVAGVSNSGFDAHRRKVNSVFYVLDTDAGRARWVSMDARADEWTSQFIREGASRESVAQIFPWVRQTGWQSEAPAAALPSPVVEVLEDRAAGGVRFVRLRLTSARRAPSMLFFTEPETDVHRAFVNGQPVLESGDRTPTASGDVPPPNAPPGLRVSYAAPPPEGIELLLEIRDTSPLRLILEDISYELPEVPGQTFTPRSAHMMPAPSFRSSDTTIVRRKFELDARAGSTQAGF